MSKPKFPAFSLSSQYLGVFLLGLVLIFSVGLWFPKGVISQEKLEFAQHSPKLEFPIVVAARFRVKPERRSLFLELAEAALEPTRREPGNISYSLYEETTVPHSFILFEEWESREDLDLHLKLPHTKRLLDRFPELVDGEANIRIYDIENVTYGLETI